jgi:hypothetical protein
LSFASSGVAMIIKCQPAYNSAPSASFMRIEPFAPHANSPIPQVLLHLLIDARPVPP